MKLKDGTPIKYVKASEVGSRPCWYVWKRNFRNPCALPVSAKSFYRRSPPYGDDMIYGVVVNVAEPRMKP